MTETFPRGSGRTKESRLFYQIALKKYEAAIEVFVFLVFRLFRQLSMRSGRADGGLIRDDFDVDASAFGTTYLLCHFLPRHWIVDPHFIAIGCGLQCATF
jgi:hypothetical protein